MAAKPSVIARIITLFVIPLVVGVLSSCAAAWIISKTMKRDLAALVADAVKTLDLTSAISDVTLSPAESQMDSESRSIRTRLAPAFSVDDLDQQIRRANTNSQELLVKLGAVLGSYEGLTIAEPGKLDGRLLAKPKDEFRHQLHELQIVLTAQLSTLQKAGDSLNTLRRGIDVTHEEYVKLAKTQRESLRKGAELAQQNLLGRSKLMIQVLQSFPSD